MFQWLLSFRIWKNRHVRRAGYAYFHDVRLGGKTYHIYGRIWRETWRKFTVEVFTAQPTTLSDEHIQAAADLAGQVVTFYRANQRCECNGNPLDRAVHLKDFLNDHEPER